MYLTDLGTLGHKVINEVEEIAMYQIIYDIELQPLIRRIICILLSLDHMTALQK
jgi:hypothetical protein